MQNGMGCTGSKNSTQHNHHEQGLLPRISKVNNPSIVVDNQTNPQLALIFAIVDYKSRPLFISTYTTPYLSQSYA